MVLGRQVSNEDGQSFMQAVELTEDHKPDNPIECRRINEAGGRVDRLVSGMGWQNVLQPPCAKSSLALGWQNVLQPPCAKSSLAYHTCQVAFISMALLGEFESKSLLCN